MATPLDPIVGYEQRLCESCDHSFVWHMDEGPAGGFGCTVAGCDCFEMPPVPVLQKEQTMRRLLLVRDEDVSGMSGTGVVAEGLVFSSGVVVLQWMSDYPTSVVFHDRGIESVLAIHGHGGKSRIEWVDA